MARDREENAAAKARAQKEQEAKRQERVEKVARILEARRKAADEKAKAAARAAEEAIYEKARIVAERTMAREAAKAGAKREVRAAEDGRMHVRELLCCGCCGCCGLLLSRRATAVQEAVLLRTTYISADAPVGASSDARCVPASVRACRRRSSSRTGSKRCGSTRRLWSPGVRESTPTSG